MAVKKKTKKPSGPTPTQRLEAAVQNASRVIDGLSTRAAGAVATASSTTYDRDYIERQLRDANDERDGLLNLIGIAERNNSFVRRANRPNR